MMDQKQVMVQAVYIGNYARILADIKGEAYSTIMYNQDGFSRVYTMIHTQYQCI